MRKRALYMMLLAGTGAVNVVAQTAVTESDIALMEQGIRAIVKEHNPVGKLTVDSVMIDDAGKVVAVGCGESLGYLSLSPEDVNVVKESIRRGLPAGARDYDLRVTVGDWTIDQLSTSSGLKMTGPTETGRFVTDLEAPAAPKGLDGANIALWQSHGWYYEPKLNRWEWQRARIFQTVEDLYTQSYVMPYLMPMLENAGAYVMSPRERDTSTVEIIVDGDGGLARGAYAEQNGAHAWQAGGRGFGYVSQSLGDNENPFAGGTTRVVETTTDGGRASKATWSAEIPAAGDYAVYVSYGPGERAASDASYTIHSAAGDRHFKVNQQMGAGTWIYLGHFALKGGEGPVVTLSNVSGTEGATVSADAVKIGGGMGNVARLVMPAAAGADTSAYRPVTSGYPRFTEGARYWLQWAGMPAEVYTPSGNVNDYQDDYRCRGLWVNYIAGGSSMVPGRRGLKIPVDLALAFHSDAGTTKNDSIIGTLSIYCTRSHDSNLLGNGTPRVASRRLSDLVATEITEDIRRGYEPAWTRRAMWDKSYFEAREPEVPTMLLELLSHQNFADMKYGLDPSFRFTVSRGIYKGMLKFIAERDGRDYVVQPLPVRSFAIGYDGRGKDAANYTLTWQPTPDETEPTAMPTFYQVYRRVDAGAFELAATVAEPRWTTSVSDGRVYSFRIVAGNEGGVSFPGEVLSLCDNGREPDVLIVNGFTRVSGPDTFDSGEIAGFYDARDHGVPYVRDISFIGSQFEFRRDIPWMDDDAAGFGASRANYEDKVIAGNTMDNVYIHGEAIARSGRSFISTSVSAFAGEGATPVDRLPAVIDLILGKQKEIKVGTGAYGTRFKTFTPALQKRLEAATSGGRSVFVSGSYVATDLWDNPYSSKETLAADQAFATKVLGYHWRVGQATVEGNAFEVPSRFGEFKSGSYDFATTLNADSYAVESPDSFYASDSDKGATILRYGENNLVAGTAMAADRYRTVVIGFPFESILSPARRIDLMTQVLDFFAHGQQPAVAAKTKGKKGKKK